MTIVMLLVSFANNKINFSYNTVKSKEAKRYLILYLIMIIGVPFSVHRGDSFNFIIFNYLSNILYFYFFVIYVDSKEKVETIFFVVCMSACFYAALSILKSGVIGERFGYGTMYDPNDLAYFLNSLFPMNLYFLICKSSSFRKIAAITTIILSLGLSLMTGSRGGLLGLVTVFIVLFFTRFSPLKTFQKLLLIVMAVALLGLNSEKINIERFDTILNPEEDYNVTGEEGRLSIWMKGLELTARHPITGVGVNCFANAIGNFRIETGDPPLWQAPHSSFIQVLTELGVVGFLVYLSMIGRVTAIFFSGGRGKSTDSGSSDQLVIMSKLLFVAFLGNVVCSFFLSMAYSMHFTLFLALSVVVQELFESEKRDLCQPDEGTLNAHAGLSITQPTNYRGKDEREPSAALRLSQTSDAETGSTDDASLWSGSQTGALDFHPPLF